MARDIFAPTIRQVSQGISRGRTSGRSSGVQLSRRNMMIAGGSVLGAGAIARGSSTGRGSTPGHRSLYGPPGRKGQYY